MCSSQKALGPPSTVFPTSRYRYTEVGNIFVNISAKIKIFSKIFWDVDLGPRYIRFGKKTGAPKSHASVPLKGQGHEI